MEPSLAGGRRGFHHHQQHHQPQQHYQNQHPKHTMHSLDDDNDAVMYLPATLHHNHRYTNGVATASSSSSSSLDNTLVVTTTTATLPFPHFPPPPDYPPPQHQLLQQLKYSSSCTNNDVDVNGVGSGGVANGSAKGGKKMHRYPDDLDSIELCLEPEPKPSYHTMGGIHRGVDRTSGAAAPRYYNDVDPQVKWSRNNIAATMERFEPASISQTHTPQHRMQHDYAYAYHEAESHRNQSTSPLLDVAAAGPSKPPPRNSMRALMSTANRNGGLIVPSATRHMYTTRYGTQENIYEEIGAEERIRILNGGQSLVSLNQSLVEEEFRRVQNRHRRVLGELNLSVEAMLMPSTPPSDSPNEDDDDNGPLRHDGGVVVAPSTLEKLLNTVGPTDELLSPVSVHAISGGSGGNGGGVGGVSGVSGAGDMDSGFSGSSSSASCLGSIRYRNGLTAVGRSTTPNGGNASVYSGSIRSAQRSHEDPGQMSFSSRSSSSFGGGGSGRGSGVGVKNKVKSAEDPGPPSVLETTKKTSFWSRKGWRKLPGFSSSTSVHKAGLLNDEHKLNSGAWEDPLPLSNAVKLSQQLHAVDSHRNDHNYHHHHNHHHQNNHTNPFTAAAFTNNIHQLHKPNFNNNHLSGVSAASLSQHLNGYSPHIAANVIGNCHNTTTAGAGTRTGGGRRLEHTPSARTISSDDSWCSERGAYDNELSSEGEDESDRSVTSTNARNSQLRSTLNKAKHHLSFEKWRGSNNSSSQSSSGSANTSTTMPSPQNQLPPQQQHQHHQNDATSPGESPGGRLSRWFSIRRGSSHHYDIGGKDTSRSSSIETDDKPAPPPSSVAQTPRNSCGSKMPQLSETEEDSNAYGLGLMGNRSNGGSLLSLRGVGSRQITPALPPPPAGLSQQQLKRRHIVAAIVHSENSYNATLQRLVNDYKKPLEESNPPILSCSKISTLFHRLPEILQCHTLFRIALADCVRNWDRDEQLGDVFVGSFSKPVVLDIYSGFINNFSAAMELAKMEAKRKSALADFFKVKQISAHDRLSFFGLMVKPVQRFPQFILFLQDLLKYTPQGHHDRMSLQLALTQLESLAEMLNERKREAEQYQAFKEMLAHISGTFNTRSLSSTADGNRQRYLLREDNVTQLEFNQSGFIVKSKQRRLLLLNDKVICVSVAPKQSHDFGATEKLSFKWMFPVTDVEIVDTSTSATLSRILTAGLNRGGSLKSNSSGDATATTTTTTTTITNGADNLCNEMSTLMHDYEVMSRINDLVGTLKGGYKELSTTTTRHMLNTIQLSIQKKDEEMAWADSCCLQLIVKNKSGKEETMTFQTDNPSVKKEWVTELRLAQLALDANNSPAWSLPEHELHPSTKMPLFVRSKSVYKSHHQTEVRCGCYYTTINPTRTSTRRRSRNQSYLWICTQDGISSHIAIMSQHQQRAGELKDIGSFDVLEQLVTSVEFVKGIGLPLAPDIIDEHLNPLDGDTIWMGTENRKLIIYAATTPEQERHITTCTVPAAVTQILYHVDCVFVALSNGALQIFRRGHDTQWLLKDPQTIALGAPDPVSNLLPINANVYAGCGRKVWVINGLSGEILKPFDVQHIHHGNSLPVNLMAHSGIGLWVSLKNSSVICLYHTETFKHLQDINIASNVLRVTSSQRETVNNNSTVHVTALVACRGLLWVGTNVGISLTIPLPRLEGVPIISGGVNISVHAHFGPITFLLPLLPKTYAKPVLMAPTAKFDLPPVPAVSTAEQAAKEESNEVVAKIDEQPPPVRKKLEKQNSLDIASKLRAQLTNSPVVIRRRRFKDLGEISRASKTLPRGLGSAAFFSSSIYSNTSSSQGSEQGGCCDVYGLYGGLIFVKEDFDAEQGAGNLMDPSYENLRRSDPELAAIPAKVSTLDRRLRMKVSRPRSLDLSNWSVDSRSSSLYTSSGSEESMGIRMYAGRSVSRNSSSASHKAGNGSDLMNICENGTGSTDTSFDVPDNAAAAEGVLSASAKVVIATAKEEVTPIVSTTTTTTMKKKKPGKNNAQPTELAGRRTVIMLMGGRGYINWNHVWHSPPVDKRTSAATPIITRVPNSNDAHIVIWEKKL